MTALVRWTALAVLLGLRLPSILQPAAADQSLYSYIGVRILAGEAPYVDAWDQKPPGIHLLYAGLWALWPDERVVNAADLTAAVAVCVLLVVLGRRIATPAAGWLAAGIFALLANPSMHRLSGVFLRGQCETFIALAITGALVLATVRSRRTGAMAGVGVLLGLAIWLKYTAAVFALPLAAAAYFSQSERARRPAVVARDLAAMMLSTAAVGALGLGWLASHDALADLWLATFDYNVAYSGSSYSGPGAMLTYLLTMPVRQARHELIWLLGLGGVLMGALTAQTRRVAAGLALWIGAAIVAIAVNGRDLPQYFVQAAPALSLAGGVGLVSAWRSRQVAARAMVVALLMAGFWRVGTEAPVLGPELGGIRLAGLPSLAENIRFDLAHWRGQIGRQAYLDRFGGQRTQDKYSARDVEELAAFVRSHSAPADSILVFGFSPGVYVKARRTSASRFFWSFPVVIRFADGTPGYSTSGLLEDLDATGPSLVVLQKGDYPDEDSYSFFMNSAALAHWLASRYDRMPEAQFSRYDVWRRRARRPDAQGAVGGNGSPRRMASRISGD